MLVRVRGPWSVVLGQSRAREPAWLPTPGALTQTPPSVVWVCPVQVLF